MLWRRWMGAYISKNRFTNVQFSQAICKRFEESLIDRTDQFIDLMKKVGVDAEITRVRKCHEKCETYKTDPRISVELKVKSNEQFRKHIGFRHCIEKQLKLEIASSYENYCKKVVEQNIQAMKIVNDSMLIECSIPNAIKKVKEYYEENKIKPLNKYYSLLTSTYISNRRKHERATTLEVFDYKFMESASNYIEMIGAKSWFESKYIIDRADLNIPTYNLTIMNNCSHKVTKVYDIGVSKHHMFIANGTIVSNCIPSRMTIAHMMETLMGRLACEVGALGDGTPFNGVTADHIANYLMNVMKLEPHGNEVMYCGHTGRQMETSIFMGPIFYQRLKHMAEDKLHSRASGPTVMLTRQPAEGRAREGGLRFGEMERDVMIAHGASEFLKERMLEVSDSFETYICKLCGLIAQVNPKKGKYECKSCMNTTSFAQVRIPYPYKLFLQELESMAISSRILPASRLREIGALAGIKPVSMIKEE